MKKIIQLFFIISFLIISISAHAKVITLSNCGENNDVLKKEDMDKSKYIKKEYIIDTDKKIVKYNEIQTDSHFEKQKNIIVNAQKIYSRDFQIEYSDGKFVKAIRKSTQLAGVRHIMEMNLNEKTILHTTEMNFTDGGMKNFRYHTYCGGGRK